MSEFYTFQEIIQSNGQDWDKAYQVLQYHLMLGNLRKEILGPENIIYHPKGKIKPLDLIYERIFYDNPEKTNKGMWHSGENHETPK